MSEISSAMIGQWLLKVFAVLAILSAGCAPRLGERPALPTAMPGISSNDAGFATPAVKSNRTKVDTGPTSTPAPWATALPPTPRPPPPAVTHPLAGSENCFECHYIGSYYFLPADHAKRSLATCLGCHRESEPIVVPPITHAVAGREACLMCHLQGKNKAPIEPGDHAGRMNDICLDCHKPK